MIIPVIVVHAQSSVSMRSVRTGSEFQKAVAEGVQHIVVRDHIVVTDNRSPNNEQTNAAITVTQDGSGRYTQSIRVCLALFVEPVFETSLARAVSRRPGHTIENAC